jgi:hypothetical protein
MVQRGMSRRAAKVITTSISVLGAVILCLWMFFQWKAHTYRANVALQYKRFIENKSKFEALVPQWRILHPTLDECGNPEPPPGLVRFAVIGLPSGTGYRIGGNQANGESSDVTVGSIEEAASILHASQSDLRRFFQQMKDASITGIYQHESELHFIQDYDPPLGVMFIPIACPKSSNYKFWSTTKGDIPFATLDRQSEEWYFYQAKR